MLIIYILIIVLLLANINKFRDLFGMGFNKSLSLHTYVEPIIRCFNTFKFKDYNVKYGIKTQ